MNSMPLMDNMNKQSNYVINDHSEITHEKIKKESFFLCDLNDCLNGGFCYYSSFEMNIKNVTKCKCQLGFSGTKCEKLTAVTLKHEDSYIELEPPDFERVFNLSVRLFTNSENGIIFYHGSKLKEHIAAEIYSGYIRISFDIGNTQSSTIFSYTKLNNKKEHEIEFIVDGKNFNLIIKSTNEKIAINNQGKFDYLYNLDEPLYIGGVPNSIKERITKDLSHIKNASSFNGCIHKLIINNEIKDLHRVAFRNKIKFGCDPCQLNFENCKNKGVCIPKFNLKNDFTCDCLKGYTGELCELKENLENNKRNISYRAVSIDKNFKPSLKNDNVFRNEVENMINNTSYESSTSIDSRVTMDKFNKNCIQETTIDYYIDSNKCKSKKKIKIIKCKGECLNENIKYQFFDNPNEIPIGTNNKNLNYFCMPSNIIKRKIMLFCNDGTSKMLAINDSQECKCRVI
jgi:hypothetical protein